MSQDIPAAAAAWAGEPERVFRDDPEFQRAFHYFDRYYAPYLPQDPASHILDYGCGFGSFLAYLGSRGYTQARGFDVDGRCVAFCVERVTPAVTQAEDGRAFLLSQVGEFDFILVRQVAYYFPVREAPDYFRALALALRPGGRVIVEVFNGALATGLYPTVNDHWINTAFTEHSLRWALEGAGLRVIRLFGASGTGGGGVRYGLWQTGRRVWSAALRAIYLLERGRDPLNPTVFEKNLIALAEAYK